MIDWIHIHDYRSISSLCIDPFATVNVLIGRNGTGKTSVLEAIALACSPASSVQIARISSWREFPSMRLGVTDAIRSLFPALNLSLAPTIEFSDTHEIRRVTIAAIVQPPGEGITFSFPPRPSADTSFADDLFGLSLSYEYSKGRSVGSKLVLTEGGYQEQVISLDLPVTPDNPRTIPSKGQRSQYSANPPRLGCFYISPRRSTSLAETADVLTSLKERKEEHLLVDAVRSVDPRVRAFAVGSRSGQPVILVDVGLDRLVPLNTLGDGFCRVVLFLTGVLSAHSRVLVIDEIDAGLHYSVMPGVWKSLVSLAKKIGFQIFATTHNEDMLRSLTPAFSDRPSDLRLVRLSRNDAGVISAIGFGYENLQAAIDAGLEIR